MDTDIEPPRENIDSPYPGAGFMFRDGSGAWHYFGTHTIEYFNRKLDDCNQ